jgi:uncharacterized repeat protein (TIGR03803 family)
MTTALQHRVWISGTCLGIASAALAVVLALAVLRAQSAQAQTFTILHTFTGYPTDGEMPSGSMVMDAAGNLYGATAGGGTDELGTVFRLGPNAREKVLHNFTVQNGDGLSPLGGVIRDQSGNLYGTTFGGGTHDLGAVFRVDAEGNETLLHSFAGGPTDGAYPYVGSLLLDQAGNLYGTTARGGAFGSGTVFKLDPASKLTLLHSFTGGPSDGATPLAASLVRDAAGNLYGITYYGGSGDCTDGVGFGCGTVFKVDTTGAETVLHSFSGADGQWPIGDLLMDAAGNLYGTTWAGGPSNARGVVFKLAP